MYMCRLFATLQIALQHVAIVVQHDYTAASRRTYGRTTNIPVWYYRRTQASNDIEILSASSSLAASHQIAVAVTL